MQVRIIILAILASGSLVYCSTTEKKTPQRSSFTLLTDRDASLKSPVYFSAHGVQHFLTQVFNNHRYAQDILAHDFSHLGQFLTHGKTMEHKRTYSKSVFRMFGNKLKATPFVNAYAFSGLVKDLPQLLRDYFIVFTSGDLNPAKATIEDLLYSSFINSFTTLKERPDQFFNDLSNEIVQTLNNKYHLLEDLTLDEVRKSLLLFLELGVNKLVWDPMDRFTTWENCKTIADGFHTLLEMNIIADPDDLNDLYITLIERYCYFLELTGTELPTSFYEQIKHDVASQQLFFLEMEEQEPGLETKAERLMRSLIDGEAKARGRELGIITR